MKRYTLVLGVALLLGSAGAAGAQGVGGVEFAREQFAHWDGIAFNCLPFPNDDWTGQVCEAVMAAGQYLATTASMRSLTCVDCSEVDILQRAADLGIQSALEVKIWFAADIFEDGGARAVGAFMLAGRHYQSAVELGSHPSPVAGHPKNGFLAMWQSHWATATFDPEYVARAYKDDLKQLFAALRNARN
jgi:hypothetical protein